MQTAIITGGNGGLGYQCARAIAAAAPQWHVIIASRDHTKSIEAARAIIAETGNLQVEAMELNLGSLDSVRRFASDFAARALPPIGAIVCNAGIQTVSEITYSDDGYETTFAVNHLGHFLLVNLLLRHLSDRARIVVVSSGTHNPDQFTGMPKPDYRDAISVAKREAGVDAANAGRRAYTTSKLCNVMFTYELSRRLQAEGHAGVSVTAFDPGLMPGTGLARDYTPFMKFVWNFVLPALRFIPNVNGVRKSGNDLARLVLDAELEGVTGKYFVGRKSVPSSKESYDERKAAELWESSVSMVHLKPQETILRSGA
ncbi:MAG TPA: SDR family NAD(P)-dependent oxidoreductase [Candidatus Binataceae bacterium]|nr:SDR family NAD(P)-dependent oxidoreductase [Candidatus Binataceae bacterium]